MPRPDPFNETAPPSEAVETYLSATIRWCLDHACDSINTGQLAAAIQVTSSSATIMVKKLMVRGLAVHHPYEEIRLTDLGWMQALRSLRKHRLLELFLVRTLHFTWDQVHAEAARMEHAVSDLVINRIDELLGFPTVDPHGDPIPSAEGQLRDDQSTSIPLVSCNAGQQCRIVRIIDQRPEFLRYLSSGGVAIGVPVIIDDNHKTAGVLKLGIDGRQLTLGHAPAAGILVVNCNVH